MRLLWVVVLFGTACGSKGLSTAAAHLRESDGSELTDCSFIGKVTGEGTNATQAKNVAKEKAADAGATHIKWIVPCCTSVEAEAYRCDVPD
ncbi:MAG TPA: hypothetical protein VL326_27935 [Kofleriaceae bacterium]|jgi:hypothetical protein|nr:hypothetical protein [Kofleriaceae bacterium]